MKNSLFSFVAVTSAALISFNTAVGSAVVGVITGAFNAFNLLVRAVGTSLMAAIDKDRYEYTSSLVQQRGDLTELGILKSITQVKESALQQEVWTMWHTAAMNQLGNALHMQCGWEPARVHGYMRKVMEGIPGLVYYGGDDFESDTETV